uniref:Uncharacterized protein n=1 Tax=Ditylenchus dipsaci TaxID=166011 RepID=A0A915CLF7_9BILA
MIINRYEIIYWSAAVVVGAGNSVVAAVAVVELGSFGVGLETAVAALAVVAGNSVAAAVVAELDSFVAVAVVPPETAVVVGPLANLKKATAAEVQRHNFLHQYCFVEEHRKPVAVVGVEHNCCLHLEQHCPTVVVKERTVVVAEAGHNYHHHIRLLLSCNCWIHLHNRILDLHHLLHNLHHHLHNQKSKKSEREQIHHNLHHLLHTLRKSIVERSHRNLLHHILQKRKMAEHMVGEHRVEGRWGSTHWRCWTCWSSS